MLIFRGARHGNLYEVHWPSLCEFQCTFHTFVYFFAGIWSTFFFVSFKKRLYFNCLTALACMSIYMYSAQKGNNAVCREQTQLKRCDCLPAANSTSRCVKHLCHQPLLEPFSSLLSPPAFSGLYKFQFSLSDGKKLWNRVPGQTKNQ